LFDAIQSHEQQKQDDEHTLRKIRAASKTISVDFYKAVLEKFGDEMLYVPNWSKSETEKTLPSGSGMVIFVVASEEEYVEDDTYDKLCDFFQTTYSEYKALMRVSYSNIELDIDMGSLDNADEYVVARVDAEILKKIKAIKKKLKDSSTSSKIIDASKDTLFQFQQNKMSEDEYRPLLPFPPFMEKLNDLRPDEDKTDDHRFHIAFLKADLNGMGEAFAKVENMKDYRAMSEILNCWVCENGIGSAISEVWPESATTVAVASDAEREPNSATPAPSLDPAPFEDENKTPSVYPLYAAGDDIFVACKVNDIARTVKVLEHILIQINKELRASNVRISGKYVQLKMRVGLDISYVNQPIRYYYRRADNAMESAKKACEIPDLIKNRGSVMICVEGMPLITWDMAHEVGDEYDECRCKESAYEKAREELRERYIEDTSKLGIEYASLRQEYKDRGYSVDSSDISFTERLKEYKKVRGEKIKNIEAYKDELKGLMTDEYKTAIDALEKLYEPTDHFLWKDFLNDVAVLRHIIDARSSASDSTVAITTHLHNVLDALEALKNDKDDGAPSRRRHINRVLYSVLPVQLTSVASVSWGIPKKVKSLGDKIPSKVKDEYKMELTLWHMLVKRLFTGSENSTQFINKEHIGKFITYLKLLLTFISPHFNVAVDKNGGSAYKAASKAAIEEKDKWMNNVVCDKLYKQNSGELFKVFVGKKTFYSKAGKSFHDYVLLVAVEKSMLYRFKQLLHKKLPYGKPFELAINMITNKELNKKAAFEQLDVRDKERDAERKRRNALARNALDAAFSEKIKKRLILNDNNKKAWNEDLVDSLIVFYSYYNLRNRLRTIFGTKKKPEE
jgi:hypothetical protein